MEKEKWLTSEEKGICYRSLLSVVREMNCEFEKITLERMDLIFIHRVKVLKFFSSEAKIRVEVRFEENEEGKHLLKIKWLVPATTFKSSKMQIKSFLDSLLEKVSKKSEIVLDTETTIEEKKEKMKITHFSDIFFFISIVLLSVFVFGDIMKEEAYGNTIYLIWFFGILFLIMLTEIINKLEKQKDETHEETRVKTIVAEIAMSLVIPIIVHIYSGHIYSGMVILVVMVIIVYIFVASEIREKMKNRKNNDEGKKDLYLKKIKVKIKKLLDGGEEKELYRMIEEEGISDMVFQDRTTPLMLLAKYNNIFNARTIVEKGGNINFQDKEGMNVLMHAICWENDKMIKFLLENKVNLNLRDSKGRTVFGYIDFLQNKEIKALIKNKVNEEIEK